MMYMGDFCGELAKSIFWRVAERFFKETTRMTWKGDWAYCSPYSRKLVCQEIDHYYILKKESRESSIPEPFVLKFSIEACEIVCKYSDAYGDDTPENISHGAEISEEDMSLPVTSGADKYKEGASSSHSTGGAPDGSSSAETNGEREYYICTPSHVNKVEVSLSLHEADEALESYTFYQRDPEGVAEVKRALEILKDHGNLIFSSFHRNIGSQIPKAHARCYEFVEIFELILNGGYKLHQVTLQSRYACSISGSTVFEVLNIALLVWIQYYQLNNAPKPSLISILVLFIFFQWCLRLVGYAGQKRFAKRCLYRLIALIAPNHVEVIYRFFQVKIPYLTFCNQSYGYPYTSDDHKVICCFPGLTLPTTDTILTPQYLSLFSLQWNFPYQFDLRTLYVVLSGHHIQVGELVIDVLIRRKYDNVICYRHLFKINDYRKVANLVALLKWLVEHECLGVCKEWPRRDLMHAYSYEELLSKVLVDGEKPWLISWSSPIHICVEGLHSRRRGQLSC